MKAILIGSAIPDVLVRKAVDARLPVHVTYGLTEMASQVATSKRLTKENPLPVGQILRSTQVRISDDHEILVKGKTLFQGYVKEERVEPTLDKQGWFHTGDLGCLNDDGTLTVLGRKDNMFISGGENIQPGGDRAGIYVTSRGSCKPWSFRSKAKNSARVPWRLSRPKKELAFLKRRSSHFCAVIFLP